MPIDTSIIGRIQEPQIQQVNPIDQYAKGMQLKGMLLQNQQAQQAFADDQAQRQAFSQSGGDASKYLQALASGGNYKAYQSAQLADVARQKAAADLAEVQAKTGQANATTAKTAQETKFAAAQQHAQDINMVRSPEDIQAYVDSGIAKGVFPAEARDQMLQKAAQFPTIDAWKQAQTQAAIPVLDRYKQEAENSRNANTVSATMRGQELSAQTSRSNNAATIAKDYAVAGMTPGGGVSPDMDVTAKAIASGQLPAPSGMALLNPKNQRILSRVMEINPEYDASSTAAKMKAARDFTSGSQGNAMRSFAVAGNHLDQLGTLVDALDNGNMQIVNKVGNAFASQTGNPAPTNFDAAKDVVSKEVVKAIVAGGGGVAERQELSNLMDKAKSPAQLKGVIQQYRNLMDAQHGALLQQRRAAGLPDSTLPDYSATEGAAKAPPASQTFNSLPDPATLSGKRLQGPDGKVMRSNGKAWVPE